MLLTSKTLTAIQSSWQAFCAGFRSGCREYFVPLKFLWKLLGRLMDLILHRRR